MRAKSTNVTYQENDRDIETESNHGVQQEGEVANAVKVSPGHGGNLDKQSDNSVHDGASGSKVVERDQRVHLELGRREKALHHGQANGLENDTGDLEEESEHDELDLAERGNDDTNNDERHVSESLHVGGRKTHDPGCDQDSDGSGSLCLSQFSVVQHFRIDRLLSYLNHLNEGDGEVEVGEVTANERQREEDTNGNNGSKVDSAVHGDLLPRIQDCGETSEDLGADGRKTEMPCCEENREACKVMSWNSMAVAQGANLRKFSFFSSRMYLLKRMTLELMAIQTLRARYQLPFLPLTLGCSWARLTQHRERDGCCSEEEQASRGPG